MVLPHHCTPYHATMVGHATRVCAAGRTPNKSTYCDCSVLLLLRVLPAAHTVTAVCCFCCDCSVLLLQLLLRVLPAAHTVTAVTVCACPICKHTYNICIFLTHWNTQHIVWLQCAAFVACPTCSTYCDCRGQVPLETECAVDPSSVLKCVAVCCSVLQCVVVCRSVLQCVAVYSSVSKKYKYYMCV